MEIHTPPAQALDGLTRREIDGKSLGLTTDIVIPRASKQTRRSRPLSSYSYMADDASEEQVFKKRSLVPVDDKPSRAVRDFEDWLQLASSTAEDHESDVEH